MALGSDCQRSVEPRSPPFSVAVIETEAIALEVYDVCPMPSLSDTQVRSLETPVRLRHAAMWVGDLFLELRGDPDTPLLGLSADWTLVRDGDLYFLSYASERASRTAAVAAQSRGASALCVRRPFGTGHPELVVTDVHRALSRVAAAFNGSPADDLVLSAVTGTKGKTTTTYLLKSILAAAGEDAGLIGSIGAWVGERHVSSKATTPEAPELHALMAQMKRANLKKVVLEVSSHGISRQRIHGLRFATIAFTNLSRDHFDEYGDMASYFEAKAALFGRGTTQCAALNVDDVYGRALRERCAFPTRGFGLTRDADVRAETVQLGPHGSEFVLCTPEGDRRISTPLNRQVQR